MKKKILLLSAAACLLGNMTFAQSTENDMAGSDMENWRTYSVGIVSPLELTAPKGWFGIDSLFAGIAPFASVGMGIEIKATQMLFKSDDAHEGASSAEVMSKDLGDTLGIFAGILSNAEIGVDISGLSGGGDTADIDVLSLVTYTGGTNVTEVVEKVNAWVKTDPDNTDDAAITAMAFKTIRNAADDADSSIVIGEAYLTVANDVNEFTEVELTLDYISEDETPDRLIVIFTSSDMKAEGDKKADNSLKVDGVTYTTATTGIKRSIFEANNISVYPNPATNAIHFKLNANEKPENYTLTIIDINGKILSQEPLKAQITNKDVSAFAKGNYFYNLTNTKTSKMESGKFTVK